MNWLGSSEFKQLLKTCDNFQEIVLRSCTLLSLIYIIENTKNPDEYVFGLRSLVQSKSVENESRKSDKE